jgi:RND superfamily putative drug exporter
MQPESTPVGLGYKTRFRALTGLFAVLAGCVALGILGVGVEEKLDPLSLTIADTPSADGEALADAHFGESTPFAVLLSGPAAAIERQGPPLVRALRRQPDATVISPWDRGTVTALRPGPRRALVVVDYHQSLAKAMRDTVPALQGVLEERIHPPLRATQSGFASVSRALQEETLHSTERAELIAVPLLLIALLLVFRSLVAAAIPLAFGALTVFAGRGVLVLLSSAMPVDSISLVVCTMMGLALGVDYSLLIVSRFREELAGGRSPLDAARRSRATAGRTTVLAGSTLLAALGLSAYLQPGSLLLSLAATVGIATVLSVLVAVVALPGLLALLGPRVNAGAIAVSAARPARSRVAAIAGSALRRPGLAVVAISVPLMLLATPALGFRTGAPGIDELPTSDPARQSAETIEQAVGPGWEAPFVLVAAVREGPVTTPERLALLSRWQRRITAHPGVRAVIGPAPIARGAEPLRQLGEVLSSPGPGGPGELSRLGPGLRQVAGAVSRLRGGLARAAAGSGLLGEGAGRAQQGAGLLAAGLERAGSGGERASGAVARLAEGSKKLADAQRKTAVGTLSLKLGLRSLFPRLDGNGLGRARELASETAAAARDRPELAPLARRARILARVIASARDEVQSLRGLADRVDSGLNRISSGGKKLEDGVGQLESASAGLTAGLDRLGSGAAQLAGGLGRLEGGADALQLGLADGFHRSYPLEAGLRRSSVRISAATAPLVRGARRLRRSSPGLFDSGYFVLSALEGGSAQRRELVGEAISVGGGGQAARMLVISEHGLNSPESRRLGARLEGDAERIARAPGFETGLAGGAAIVNDYAEVTRARIPLVVGAVVVACFLMLLLILRAPLLAGLAVVLNLASVTAAIGVMSLICRFPAGWPLGGHPYVDTVGAAAIFGVTFGLSIDYAVFLLARMRESWLRDGDNRAAIAYGLERTAAVITGAAAIMAAVFVSFAASPVATVSQMGVGLTVAILLDATVVRIVLLPALMLLFGERVWHTPPWLERILPNVDPRGMATENVDVPRDRPGGANV